MGLNLGKPIWNRPSSPGRGSIDSSSPGEAGSTLQTDASVGFGDPGEAAPTTVEEIRAWFERPEGWFGER